MDIGKRLRQLRTSKDLSQGDIERRTGLLRSYISRVKGGHIIPSLPTLDRWAKALGVDLHQLFFEGKGKPPVANPWDKKPVSKRGKQLLRLLNGMRGQDQSLLISLAHTLAGHGRSRERS